VSDVSSIGGDEGEDEDEAGRERCRKSKMFLESCQDNCIYEYMAKKLSSRKHPHKQQTSTLIASFILHPKPKQNLHQGD
jgi:hypothetical protein